MDRGAPFDVNTFEAQRGRARPKQNRQLREQKRRQEAQRAAQVAAAAEPKGPGR